jgi:hypothetical protein
MFLPNASAPWSAGFTQTVKDVVITTVKNVMEQNRCRSAAKAVARSGAYWSLHHVGGSPYDHRIGRP